MGRLARRRGDSRRLPQAFALPLCLRRSRIERASELRPISSALQLGAFSRLLGGLHAGSNFRVFGCTSGARLLLSKRPRHEAPAALEFSFVQLRLFPRPAAPFLTPRARNWLSWSRDGPCAAALLRKRAHAIVRALALAGAAV